MIAEVAPSPNLSLLPQFDEKFFLEQGAEGHFNGM